jgi:hypothetical protein
MDYQLMPSLRKPSGAGRSPTGAKVRIKYALIDPDFPDIPLGGWIGTVENNRSLLGQHPQFTET